MRGVRCLTVPMGTREQADEHRQSRFGFLTRRLLSGQAFPKSWLLHANSLGQVYLQSPNGRESAKVGWWNESWIRHLWRRNVAFLNQPLSSRPPHSQGTRISGSGSQAVLAPRAPLYGASLSPMISTLSSWVYRQKKITSLLLKANSLLLDIQ